MARLSSLETTEAITSKLGILVGKTQWLLDLVDISEVLPVPNIVEAPLTSDWFCGVTNIRGNLYSVVDLSGYWGGELTPITPLSRLLLVHSRHLSHSALLVNRMLGLHYTDQMQEIADADPTKPWCGLTWRDDQGMQWCELKIAELVLEQKFLHVALS